MCKKIILFLFFIITLSFSAHSQERTKINMDEDWKFHFGNSSDPVKDFNYSIDVIFSKSGDGRRTPANPKFNDSNWRTLDLPHDWAVELPFVNSPNEDIKSHGYKPVGGLFPETSIGWYRKHFTIAKKDSGQRFQIQFDGIFRDANIWLNGFYLGNNKSGYVGVAYDITDYINYDKDNVIAVRVDATQYEGWFYEGAGIYRHVWLNKYNNVHFKKDGVFISTTVKTNAASLKIETGIENKNLTPANCNVYSYVTDRNGKKIAETKAQPLSLLINQDKTIQQNINIQNPILWSLENPYLYRSISIIKQNGKVIDSVNNLIGIRKIEIKTDGVYLNDKYIKIKGTNNHQDHAGLGSALPDYLQYYRISQLKNMGSNAIRTSHNAPTPELLQACDSLGMLVLDEQRLLNSSPEYMDQFERLIMLLSY